MRSQSTSQIISACHKRTRKMRGLAGLEQSRIRARPNAPIVRRMRHYRIVADPGVT
jgi:hypothetical protein